MAAGDKSRELVHRVRDLLNDHDNKIIPNDKIIYSMMSTLQREWMTKYKTTKQIFEIALTAGTYEYDIPDRVLLILDYDNDGTDNMEFRIDYARRKILIDTIWTDGSTILTIEAFIKPGTHTSATDDTTVTGYTVLETTAFYQKIQLADGTIKYIAFSDII